MNEDNLKNSEGFPEKTEASQPSFSETLEGESNEDSQAEILRQLTAVQEEASLMKDQMARALADLENLRRRTQKEKIEIRQMAAAHLLEDLVPVLDSMRMGFASAKKTSDAKGITEGFVMVYEQLKKALANHGLEEIVPEQAIFDPNQHDCVSRQVDANIPEDHIIQVIRPGYKLNGRLLRAASVIISAGAEVKENSSAEC